MTLLLIFILGLALVQLGRLYFERQGARELSITLLSDVSRLEPGQTLRVYGSLFNTRGNLWYEASREGQRCFLYAGHVKLLEPEPVRSWWQRLLGIGD